MKYKARNPTEKAALDAETARYRMKQQEYQAKQNDYAMKMQAQQNAMQPQQVQPMQTAQPMQSQPPMESYSMAKPKPKKKKQESIGQMMNSFAEKNGGWNKGVLTKAEERRWKKNYG
tara:strand:+ start:9064 stop:9414 length:351 start_codon:yes stop_codon:yes gene_type:complete